MYDLIGDIHGHYRELHQILVKMGYVYDVDNHNFSHTDGRKAIFIGDFIDMGPDNLKVVSLVRNMVESGNAKAILGNHDFNAVHYAMPHPDKPGEFVRKHDEKNLKQHGAFLKEIDGNPAAYEETIAWFKTLPVYLKEGPLHCVHACWDQSAIDALDKLGAMNPDGTVTAKGWIDGGMKSSEAYVYFERLLKGPEENLGRGLSMVDRYGTERTSIRVNWWNANPKTYGEAFGLVPGTPFENNPYQPDESNKLSTSIREGLSKVALLAFGHYWMFGEKPELISERIACVDWSVGRHGQLVAYRYHGEQTFDAKNFVAVPAIP